MKAKVIIQEGKTTIELTPENDFEKDVIEKITDSRHHYDINTTVSTNFQFHEHKNHKIQLNISKKVPKKEPRQ